MSPTDYEIYMMYLDEWEDDEFMGGDSCCMFYPTYADDDFISDVEAEFDECE